MNDKNKVTDKKQIQPSINGRYAEKLNLKMDF